MPSHTFTGEALRTAFPARRLERDLYDAPAIVFSGSNDDGTILNRKSLKRHYNWFQKNGGVAFRHLTNEKEFFQHLPDFFTQHVARRRDAGDQSIFTNPAVREFLRLLIEPGLRDGWLKFAVIENNGRAIAYHYGFQFKGKFIWYKPSFDTTLSERSPGEVLLRCLLQHCLQEKLIE